MKTILALAAMAALTGASSAFAADAAKATAKDCEGYSNNAVTHNKENLELGCGLKGAQWSSDYKHHYDWCVQGRALPLLGTQSRDRELAIEKCRNKKAHTPAKGPTQKLCDNIMKSRDAHMKAGNAAQTECQKLASANKPTSAVYTRYLKECNQQNTEENTFFKQGCDKAFPNMPAPGKGPNTCAQTVKDNCPKK